jgi:hypothetical protein
LNCQLGTSAMETEWKQPREAPDHIEHFSRQLTANQ